MDLYECDYCKESFETSTLFEKHKRRCKEKCGFCNTFISSPNFTRHQKRDCSENPNSVKYKKKYKNQKPRTGQDGKKEEENDVKFHSLRRIFIASGLKSNQHHYIEPIFKELGINWNNSDETIKIINWSSTKWDEFVLKLGQVYDKIKRSEEHTSELQSQR